MKVQDIREIFSKGAVSVSDTEILVSYVFKDRVFTQSIGDGGKECLLELLQSSDSVGVRIIRGACIQILFRGSFGIGRSMAFMPVKPELTKAELDELLKNLEPVKGDPYGIAEKYKNADLNNESVVREVAEDIFDTIKETSKPPAVSISTPKRWKNLVAAVYNISGSAFYSAIIEAEDNRKGGYVEYEFSDALLVKPLIINQDGIKKINNLIIPSECMDIEGSVTEGWLNMTFYV